MLSASGSGYGFGLGLRVQSGVWALGLAREPVQHGHDDYGCRKHDNETLNL